MAIEVRLLGETDDRNSFQSGDEQLDLFFRRYAGQNQFRHHIGTTYVAVESEIILGERSDYLVKYVEGLVALGLIMVLTSEVHPSGSSPGIKSVDRSKPGIVMNLNQGLDIPAKDIPALEEAALHGSGTSALKLASFYRFIKHDSAEYSYWITISAENGDPVGMHNLAHLLLFGGDVKEKKD